MSEDPLARIRATPGMLARIARELGLDRSAPVQWTEVPVRHARVVSRLTGIPLNELRPDVWTAQQAAADNAAPVTD